VQDGIVFDYSRYMDVSNHEVSLPPNTFREFKIIIEEVVDEKESPYMELTRTLRGKKETQRVERTTIERRPFRIDQIEAFYFTTQQRVKRQKRGAYAVAGFEAQEVAQEKQTILNVRTRREPLTSFTLDTPSRNFYRRAEVQIPVTSGVETTWRSIGEATISNIHYRSYHREQLKIAFPERRQEEYRIVIHNQDNPPLEVNGVIAEGNVYRVVFLAPAAKVCRAYYGSETAQTPTYEASRVLGALRRDFQPTTVQLGEQVKNTDFGGEPGFALRKLLNNWIFLTAVIILMVAVLSWTLFRAGRHLDSFPQDPASDGAGGEPKQL
jgi:hypothetical protein